MDKVLCLSAAANDNDNDNDNVNNIIFTTKNTSLYVPVVALSERLNQKLSKLLSEGFERLVCWNENKTKNDNKNEQMNIDIFSNQILLESVDSNQDNNFKRFKNRRYYLPKKIIDDYNVIINGNYLLWPIGTIEPMTNH